MPPTRVPSRRLSPASESVHYSFALLPRFGPTLPYSTTWTSCDGTAPHPLSPHLRPDWTRRALKLCGQWLAVPGARGEDAARGIVVRSVEEFASGIDREREIDFWNEGRSGKRCGRSGCAYRERVDRAGVGGVKKTTPCGRGQVARKTESSGGEGRSREGGERPGCLVDREAVQLCVVSVRGEQKLIVHGCEAEAYGGTGHGANRGKRSAVVVNAEGQNLAADAGGVEEFGTGLDRAGCCSRFARAGAAAGAGGQGTDDRGRVCAASGQG